MKNKISLCEANNFTKIIIFTYSDLIRDLRTSLSLFPALTRYLLFPFVSLYFAFLFSFIYDLISV